MTILFDSKTSVKTTRSFARGVAPRRECLKPYSAADLEWAAREMNAAARDYDVARPATILDFRRTRPEDTDDPIRGSWVGHPAETDWDFLAAEAEAQARYEAGCLL